MLVKERNKEGAKRIDVRQVGQQSTVPQAAGSSTWRKALHCLAELS
jgi:hypothetical protein